MEGVLKNEDGPKYERRVEFLWSWRVKGSQSPVTVKRSTIDKRRESGN